MDRKMSFIIREKNSAEDMAFFAELDYESFKTTLKEQNIPEEEIRGKYKEFLKADPVDPEGPDHLILIVEDEKRRRCGLIWICRRKPFWRFITTHIWIYNLHIIEEYRGMGLANRLLMKAEDWTISQGLNLIALHVIDSNKVARYIYEKRGYKIVATHKESCFYEKKV
ncbi:MAG: GNAT family N-acetyltransferase [Promethearchaeota archaeon]